MANELNKIKRLCTQLSEAERNELKKFLEDYNSSSQKRQQMNEDLEKSLGPMSSIRCTLCGK